MQKLQLSGELNDDVVERARSAADRLRRQAALLFKVWNLVRELRDAGASTTPWRSGIGLGGLLEAVLVRPQSAAGPAEKGSREGHKT